jgi:hypothetical protein
MIQRKQSVFLFLAAVSLSVLFFLPLAKFIGDSDSLVLYVYGLESLVPDHSPDFPQLLIYLLAFIVVAMILLAIAIIFLYENRKRQLSLLKIAIILNLVLIASFFFYFVNELENVAGGLVSYEAGTYFPLVSLVFFILANRAIIADEKLIRSSDRLR